LNAPLFTAAAIVALLVGCSRGEKVVPEHNSVAAGSTITVPEFEWRIVDRYELERVYQNAGGTLAARGQLYGFTSVNPDTGAVQVWTLPPETVDGEMTTTLGHEVMHIALGDYHKRQ